MGDYHAPQWIDFIETCSPQPPIPDFFETVHMVHERDPVTENAENVQSIESKADVPSINTKAQEDLNIIKSTPVKVISPKHRNKEIMTTKTTYEQVFSDAMKKLELCKKPLRASRDALNKSQHSDVFKTPNMPISKSSRSIGYRSVPNKFQCGQNSMPKTVKLNRDTNTPVKDNSTSVNTKKTSVSCSLFKEDKDHVKNKTSESLNDSVDNSKEDEKNNKEHKNEDNAEKHEKKDNETHQEKGNDEYNEKDKEEHNEEDTKALQNEPEEETNYDEIKNDKEECDQDNVDAKIEKHIRTQPNKRATVLTWHNRRRSIYKRRSVPGNNQYISMAEAVSRFQTDTPKRFRTKSTKENQVANATMNTSRLLQNRLKPTIPISPALISKNRTRAVTVLSQEEREKLQMEEMKKHPIKANPIPRSILRSPRIKVTGVMKKQATATTHSSTTQPDEKNCAANSLQSKNMLPHHDKATSIVGSKNTVTKVLVTDPTGIIVEREEITFFGVPKDTGVTKSTTRVIPFSFEARNKDLQMKKEQRLKSLQEANKVKPEFHARPVPNFSKSSTPLAKQAKQQQIVKKPVRALPCPFSFEERDKKLPKRKEQLMKQVLEEDKRARMFRANPVPVFKPVMVRGRSKEHLSIKDKNVKMMDEHAEHKEYEEQENREPNVDSSKIDKCMQKTKSITDKMPLMEKKEGNVKILPIELNTDKRAKERREFDEKMKRKQIEQETKREEENRKRLEHEKQIKIELRKLAEVKAKPMPTYKSLIIDKATKQLTNPQSPAFASKLRMKQI